MSEPTTHYATCVITADGRQFVSGDVLDGVHPSTLESMLRMGQASATNPANELAQQDPLNGTPIATLQLPDHIVELLSKASITTVEQLDAAGPKQVAKIPGLGKSAQKTIGEAMTAFQAAAEDEDDEPEADNEEAQGNNEPS